MIADRARLELDVGFEPTQREPNELLRDCCMLRDYRLEDSHMSLGTVQMSGACNELLARPEHKAVSKVKITRWGARFELVLFWCGLNVEL